MKGVLHTDGACLGNPGPMGLGIVLEIDGKVLQRGYHEGDGTNNVAEYTALIRGMELALEKGVDALDAYLDSNLVVQQVQGNWRVKDAKLKPLHEKALSLKEGFEEFSIEHVPREENARADALSKAAAERS